MKWQDLSLREKIGQTVMLQTIPEDHIALCGSIEEFLKRYPIGGLFCAGKLVNAKMFGIENFKASISEYKKYSKYPLLFAADMENGTETDGMKLFPPEIAVAAANDPQLAYDYGRAIAMEAKAGGVNCLFNTVVDMALYPFSGTDTRGLGDDRDRVVEFAARIVEGAMSEHVISCIKHLPCGGHCLLDSHLASVEVQATKKDWEATNGYIYKALLRHDIPGAMTSHQSLPCFQTNAEIGENGEYRICTLSKELATGLIKEKLGFKGCLFTDALCMGGFTGNQAMENMIRAFEAGHDVLLWPPVQVIDEIEQRILSGRIPMERLDDAVSRVWALKERLGLFKEQTVQTTPDRAFLDDLSRRLCERCLTLIRNESGRIPLDPDKVKRVLIVGATPEDADYQKLCRLVDIFEERGIRTEIWRDAWTDRLNAEKQAEYDLILFAFSRIFHHPIGSVDVYGDQACSVWAAHACDPAKTVVASFGTPFLYKYFGRDDVFINAYWPTDDILRAFVQALFGEIPFRGISPVRLEKAIPKPADLAKLYPL